MLPRERDVDANVNEEIDAVGEVKVVDEKGVVDDGKVDEKLAVDADETDGDVGSSDEDPGTDADSQGGLNCRPDGPKAIVFCPASFNFFVFGGITAGSQTE